MPFIETIQYCQDCPFFHLEPMQVQHQVELANQESRMIAESNVYHANREYRSVARFVLDLFAQKAFSGGFGERGCEQLVPKGCQQGHAFGHTPCIHPDLHP